MKHSSRQLLRILCLASLWIAGAGLFSACDIKPEDEEKKRKEMVRPMGSDSVFRELKAPVASTGLSLPDSMRNDSVAKALKKEIRKNMTDVLTEYRKKFQVDYFTGYFLTDLDNDGFSELWVKSGNNRQNSRLQLFYPQPDGSLKVSTITAEPGNYYKGDDYLIQVVTSGPGVINCNMLRITNKGELDVENIMEIDKYENPDKEIPKFKEKQIRDISLRNLTPLYKVY